MSNGFSFLEKVKLSPKERVIINDIKIDCESLFTIPDEKKEDVIKSLAKRETIIKSMLSNLRMQTIDDEDIEYILEIKEKLDYVLQPIYNQLIEASIIHFESFYQRLRGASGEDNPHLFTYQMDEARFLLTSAIKNPKPEDILTMLMSRGSGKSYVMSYVAVFLSLYWKDYIINTQNTDYVILLTAGKDEHLDGFRSYCKEALSVCLNLGIIAKLESESSEIGCYEFKNNNGENVLRSITGANYSRIIFLSGGTGIEGKHCNVLLS